jgi:hypothetical protein
MRFTIKSKKNEYPCKKMYKQKEYNEFKIFCKLTNKECSACHNCNSLGYNTFEEFLTRCPKYTKRKLDKKFKRIEK